jgi:hypothetical protein
MEVSVVKLSDRFDPVHEPRKLLDLSPLSVRNSDGHVDINGLSTCSQCSPLFVREQCPVRTRSKRVLAVTQWEPIQVRHGRPCRRPLRLSPAPSQARLFRACQTWMAVRGSATPLKRACSRLPADVAGDPQRVEILAG